MQMQTLNHKATIRTIGRLEHPHVESDPDEGIGVFRGILLTVLVYFGLAGFIALGWLVWTHLRLHS